MFKTLLIYFILFSIIFLPSCNNDERKEVKQTIDSASQILGHELDTIINTRLNKDSLFKNVPLESVDISKLKSEDFRSALNDIFDKYDDIKDDLADDDSAGTIKSTVAFKQTLMFTSSNAPQADMDKDWRLWVSSAEKIIANLSAAKTLSAHRSSFSELSSHLETLVKNFGLNKRTIYKLTCSTLPRNTYWLTDSKELDNPYTGNDKSNGKDDRCVSVTASWKF